MALAGCGGNSAAERNEPGGISPQVMADALHTVIESDRTVYARHVVNRLQDQEQVILASEHWQDDKALPLPAQVFRMGAELAAEKTDGFRYALLSKWPVNAQNAPKTEMEAAGLDAVAGDPSQPFYGTETRATTLRWATPWARWSSGFRCAEAGGRSYPLKIGIFRPSTERYHVPVARRSAPCWSQSP